MKQTEEYLPSSFSSETRKQVQALYQQWRQKTAITCLLALSATTILALIYMYLIAERRSLFEALSMSSLVVTVILSFLLLHFENQLIRRYKQIPEMNVQPTDPAFIADRQQKYKTAARIARMKEGLLVAAGIGLVVAVPMACLVALMIFGIAFFIERDLRRKFPRDLSAAEKLRFPAHQYTRSICIGALALFGISCLLMVFEHVLYALGKGKLGALNAQAKFTYVAAEALQQDYENKNLPFEAVTVVAQYGEQNQYSTAWKEYYSAAKPDDWYALVYDENGAIRYALVSQDKITPDELKIPDEQEQRDLLGTLTRSKEAIGCYEKTPQNTEDAK